MSCCTKAAPLGSSWTGHDIASMTALAGRGEHPSYKVNGGTRSGAEYVTLQEWHHYFQSTLRWRNLRKITVAQVQDVCAAGLMLMRACGRMVAAEDTKFGDGVGTSAGDVRHPWEFGHRKTKELMLTGDSLYVDEAHPLGMVSKVIPTDQLAERTSEFARRRAQPLTMTALLIKELANQTVDQMGFHDARNSCFTQHELNHSYWPSFHENGTQIGLSEDGVPRWKDASSIIHAVTEAVPTDG